MTITLLAKLLDGRKYGEETTPEIEKLAKENGLVIVFGYSDDNMEFCGAINDEFGCFEGGTAYITSEGMLEECGCDCKYYQAAKSKAIPINAIWSDGDEYSWIYEAPIPHVTFDIYEDDEQYCRGIVFDIKNLSLKSEVNNNA